MMNVLLQQSINKINQLIDARITNLKCWLDNYSKNNFYLTNHRINHSLKQIHDQFLFTNTDKGNGNVASTFKQFCL